MRRLWLRRGGRPEGVPFIPELEFGETGRRTPHTECADHATVGFDEARVFFTCIEESGVAGRSRWNIGDPSTDGGWGTSRPTL